jgi:predicted transcriptional regulator
MSTFTSNLPDDLLMRLAETAKALALPKNKLIEKALSIYLDQITRAEYVKSYTQMNEDADILMAAEEGMAAYCEQLHRADETR